MMRQSYVFIVLLAVLVVLSSAVQFELQAMPAEEIDSSKRCLTQFVPEDTKVLATVVVGEGYNQRVDIEILDNSVPPNVYIKRKGLSNELRTAFLTKAKGMISVCFTNTLSEGFHKMPEMSRAISLDFNMGAQADVLEAEKEKLEPLELQMRMLEAMIKEVVDDIEFLKRREAQMRNTNESTNDRVKWFSLLSLFTFLLLGTWQILYLRQYFRRKRLID